MRAALLLVAALASPAAALVDLLIPASSSTSQVLNVVNGVWRVNPGESNASIAAFSQVSFTESTSACDNTRIGFSTLTVAPDGLSATFTVALPYEAGATLYPCLDTTHGGTSSFARISVGEPLEDEEAVPSWVGPVLIPVLLALSGIFSGLNLGLMALDVNELQIVIKAGTPEERKYAEKILPFRRKGNLLLCTLLLGNVLVNAVLTILLDDLAGGVTAIVGATAGIVVMGEIVPQSICSRYGLLVGAKTLPITMFFMIVTYPVAKPISLVLDWVLGREIGVVFNRKQLVHMLRVTDEWNDLDADEVQIVTGALTFSDKTVEQIMTPIEDVYMLEYDSNLDFKTMSRIIDSGHSRIPVYRGERTNIEGVLYVKELMFVDPDDNLPLKTIVEFYNHEIVPVWYDTKLDDLLSEFKRGRTHMVLVEKVVESEEGLDNRKEVIGVATLEDVIEEIIGDEIIDEHDRISDNANKTSIKPRHWQRRIELPQALQGNPAMRLTEQMQMAALTYLTTHVDPFREDQGMSRAVVQRLLTRSDCIRNIDENTAEDNRVVYHRGQPVEFFTLVLSGGVQVHVGTEEFTFTAGPFSVLGLSALSGEATPQLADFDAKVEHLEPGQRVQLICISRAVYAEALKASSVQAAANAELKSATRVVKPAAVSSNVSDDSLAGDDGGAAGAAGAAAPGDDDGDVRLELGEDTATATVLPEEEEGEGRGGGGGGAAGGPSVSEAEC